MLINTDTSSNKRNDGSNGSILPTIRRTIEGEVRRTTMEIPHKEYNLKEIENKIEKWREQLNRYKCPISQEIMKNPVILPSGQTFERKHIEEWLSTNKTCPITRKRIHAKKLIENINLKANCKEDISNYINRIIKKVQCWMLDEKCWNICKDVLNEGIEFINTLFDKNEKKEVLNQIYTLKFNIQLKRLSKEANEQVVIEYLDDIKKLNSLEGKVLELTKMEMKLGNLSVLDKFYVEMLKILMSDNENNVSDRTKRLFINLLKTILKKIKLETTLLDDSNKIQNLEDNLNELENKFVNNELNSELQELYLQLYRLQNKITYLEKAYHLDEKKEELGRELMNEYLKTENHDEYIILYLKFNANKVDTKVLETIKSINEKNKTLENEKQELENKIKNMECTYQLEDHLLMLARRNLGWQDYFCKLVTFSIPKSNLRDERFHSDRFDAYGFTWGVSFETGARLVDLEICIWLLENNTENDFSPIRVKAFISNILLEEDSVVMSDLEFDNVDAGFTQTVHISDYCPLLEGENFVFNFIIGLQEPSTYNNTLGLDI
ncbi:hypothetical protein ABK040_008071 [Willaertia magna]